jgi:hypothetical protein
MRLFIHERAEKLSRFLSDAIPVLVVILEESPRKRLEKIT